MENAITFSTKQEDGITGKCYYRIMLLPENDIIGKCSNSNTAS
jgi:hypothetical protein